MANAFVSWLEKAGATIKNVTLTVVGKILPEAAAVAQVAEPIVDLALPAYGPLYNGVVNAVIATEQAYAALGQQNGTGAQKLAAVLQAVSGTLLPKLEAAGLDSATANTVMTSYVNAIVSILNGPAAAVAKA